MINNVSKYFTVCITVVFCTFTYAKEYKWKMATSWSGGVNFEVGAKAFAEKINYLSDGKINIQAFPGGTLGKAFKVSGTVKNGVAQIGHSWMGYDWGKDKTTVLFGGWAGSMDSEKMLHWLYEAGGAELWKQYRLEKYGLISIPCGMYPSEVFLHSRKPVRNLEDLKGLKLRTSGAWLEMVKNLGAAAVTMPGGEVYTSLERGTIDATEWGTLSINVPMGLHKIAKYIIIPGVHQPMVVWELLINKKVWDKLEKRDQALIESAAKLVTLESWTSIGHNDAKALKQYKEEGNEIIVLDTKFKKAVVEESKKWAAKNAKKNKWFKKVYDHQAEFNKLWADSKSYRNVHD